MGPSLPPQCKGRVPQYNRNKLEELQTIIDELDSKLFAIAFPPSTPMLLLLNLKLVIDEFNFKLLTIAFTPSSPILF